MNIAYCGTNKLDANMKIENYPIKITPAPVVEAVIELRFKSNEPRESVFGMIYPSLKDSFPNYNSLPILQLPSQIVNDNPMLNQAPHYELINGNISVLLGPEVLSVVYRNRTTGDEYPGWDKHLRDTVFDVFTKADSTGYINTVNRLGIRYVNFFKDCNILDKTEVSIKLLEAATDTEETMLRTVLKRGNINNIIMISNKSTYVSDGIQKNGSLIDIDSFMETTSKKEDFFINLKTKLTDVHDENKKIFFSLLKDDFVATLKPEYKQ